jgi:hypothetical protein
VSFEAVGAAIKARLETKLAAKLPLSFGAGKPGRVYTSAETALIEERSQVTPGVHVVYNGANPTGRETGPKVAELEQDWQIVAVVRNVATSANGAGARAEIDPIVTAIIESLLGWKPVTGGSELMMGNSDGPSFSEGFMYVPVAFARKQTHRGDLD